MMLPMRSGLLALTKTRAFLRTARSRLVPARRIYDQLVKAIRLRTRPIAKGLHWSAGAITPKGRAKSYAALVASGISILIALHLLPSSAPGTFPRAQVPEIALALSQPHIPAVLFYEDYASDPNFQPIEIAGVTNEPGPQPDLDISIGLDVPAGETVSWYASIAGLSSRAHLRVIRNGGYASTPNFTLSLLPHLDGVGPSYLLWGTVSGPSNAFTYLQHGILASLGHLPDIAGQEFQNTVVDADLAGNLGSGVSKSGADVAVRTPALLSYAPGFIWGNGVAFDRGGGVGSPGNPRVVYAPSEFETEADVDVGLYSLQTGSATQPYVGLWDWLQQGDQLGNDATGVSPEIQNHESNQNVIAGVFFGVGASAFVAAGIEYELRPRRIRKVKKRSDPDSNP
jgi:hypothetical protein